MQSPSNRKSSHNMIQILFLTFGAEYSHVLVRLAVVAKNRQ
jgi:hypothetical protein